MPDQVNGESSRFIYLMSKLINNAVLRCQLTNNNINLILWGRHRLRHKMITISDIANNRLGKRIDDIDLEDNLDQ